MEMLLEIGIIVVITALICSILTALRQPIIIGYIISGIIVGPYFLNYITFSETFNLFSHLGIALLLFIVGLNLNPKVIKEVGKVSLITGLGQVIFTSLIGFIICRLFGLSTTVSLYVSVAITFSSTIIIMKLLSDKNDIGTLYGKISIGFLIVQDIVVIIILMIISSINQGLDNAIIDVAMKGLVLVVIIALASIYILPLFLKLIAKSQELMLLFSISWCLALATLFYYLGFSVEIGALLAGITLSLSPYRFEISSRMKPLRDFFLVIFFIMLGSQMTFANIYSQLPLIITLSLFILIGNPLIVMILMGLLGYSKRNSFLAGLTVAQISEFSLILISLGVSVGHLGQKIQSIITVIGLITIGISTYIIINANRIYPYLSRFLNIFQKSGKRIDQHKYHEHDSYDIILFGYNRIGYDLINSFKKIKKKFLVIDYDPETIKDLIKQGINCRYGDASDFEFLNEIDISDSKMIYSTIPDFDTNILLLNYLKDTRKDMIIIMVSHQIDEAIELYENGASYVIMPHFLGGYYASTMIEKFGLDLEKFIGQKIEHVEHIKKRKDIGHEHPRYHRHK